ncbi:MAG: hypothetical protein IJB97_00420 [Clostridia bacterium]|nr:hypothetical protein [Clostridia bacterium]
MNKSIVVLAMYDRLADGRNLKLEQCIAEYRISLPTFRRYLALLRDYCLEAHGREIVYDKMEKCYRLR